MGIGFSCSAMHFIQGSLPTQFSDVLPDAIRKHSGWSYSCMQTKDVYLLQPIFHNMPYRNSFVPEITIRFEESSGKTMLQITGQPIQAVRVFIRLWLTGALALQLLLLGIMVISGKIEVIPLFIPSIMLIFGYLLCKLGTRAPFRSIVTAIMKEFP